MQGRDGEIEEYYDCEGSFAELGAETSRGDRNRGDTEGEGRGTVKRLIWVISLVALIVPPAYGQSEDKVKDDPVVYMALLGTDKSVYEKDGAFAGGKDVGGRVLILVNDNPIDFYYSGASMFSLNHWIRPGENKLAVKGVHSKTLYVKIAKLKGFDYQDAPVVFKKAFPPSEKDSSVPAMFKADVPYNLPIYGEGNVIPKDQSQIKRELLAILKRVYKGLAEHEPSTAVSVLLEGWCIWDPIANNSSKENAKKFADFCNQQFSDKNKVFEPVNWDSLKFVFGPRLVMVYAGFAEADVFKTPYLFRFRKEEQLNSVPPMRFARISGRWVVWE